MSSTALRRSLERLIGRVKDDPGYRIEASYATLDLVEVSWRRAREHCAA